GHPEATAAGLRVARKLPPVSIARSLGQIQKRFRRARCDELLSGPHDQDSDGGTFRRDVAVWFGVLISRDVELDIEESKTSAHSLTYEGRPLADPCSEGKSVEAAR